MRNLVWLVVITLAIVIAAGCVNLFATETKPVQVGVNLTISGSTPVASILPMVEDSNLVPLPAAFNQSLAGFWSFTIDGPYGSDPNWTSAVLDPDPVILYDIDGKPQYYEFYLRSGGTIPGYFWTAANKLLGHGVFRIYEGSPSYNHTQITADAERVVKTRYPDYPIISDVPALYGRGYPMLCRMIVIRNTSSGSDEKIVVDAFSKEIVPDHPSEEYNGRDYAWSYLDSIPENEYAYRISQWDSQDMHAQAVVAYTVAQGIDIRLPLTPENAGWIHAYLSMSSPGPPAPEETAATALPVTDELIRENVVPVETARMQAQSTLWNRQVDRPEIYDYMSYRNATLDRKDPAIIEDFMGRKLYYVFGVGQNGVDIGEIIVVANKGLFSHPWGLETPAGGYQIANATQKARDIALQDFPGSAVLSIRPVYSLADNCCHNVTVMMEVESSPTRAKSRILVDTYTLSSRVEPVTGTGQPDANLSLFSKVTPEDFAGNAERWSEKDKNDRDFIAYAGSEGISEDLPLTDAAIVALGTFVATTLPVYEHPPPYNPMYPGLSALPTLSKETIAWHEQADWFSVLDVDALLSDDEIGGIIRSHAIPYNYTLQIHSPAIVRKYYLIVPETDYNRTFSVLTSDGSTGPDQETGMWEYVTYVKRENGMVTIPVRVGRPEEATVIRLKGQGIALRPVKTVYINSDPGVKKAEREKILAEFDTDDRVVFVRKEWSG